MRSKIAKRSPSADSPPPDRPPESLIRIGRATCIRLPIPSRNPRSGPSSPTPREPTERGAHGHQALLGVPLTTASEVSALYTSGDLLARLETRLREDGFDPVRPTFEALAPYDHFHGRGVEATEDLANRLKVAETGHVLDVGSDLGGSARCFARRFGCG